jgi:hypothetical protein
MGCDQVIVLAATGRLQDKVLGDLAQTINPKGS